MAAEGNGKQAKCVEQALVAQRKRVRITWQSASAPGTKRRSPAVLFGIFPAPQPQVTLPPMLYNNAEDRLNPVAPEGADEHTLGGYQAVHGRAAAFQATDGQPYTVAVETEYTEDERSPWAAYLIFVRWAGTGTAVMGHLETEDLVVGGSEAEVCAALEAMPLTQVKTILEDTILRKRSELAP
jgi:hypothetical protein